MQRDTFAGHVRDALVHLFDRSRLRAHPLGRLLLDPDAPAPADALRQLLLDAVEQIRPPEPCPPSSPAWRPYRYAVSRYVEGVKAERVAQELQVSIRQSRREHDRALEQITAVLWERQQPRRERATPVPATAVAGTPGPARGHDGAAEELVRFGALPPTEPVPVAASLSDALGIVARLAEIEHVDVDVHLPDALRSVWVHRLVLRQVLIDLLSCAVEIRPTGQVRIAAAESAGWLALTVAALGEAAGGARVPPDARLGASRTLIELQGGRLGVTPAPGCVFHATLLLPLAPVKTVLVVDDNPDVGYLFSRFVRDHGYRVVQASTGEAALRLCRDVRPDAITLDILMPAQDGWDLLRELAGDPRTHGIPIVLCSVLPERSLARALGVAEFLDKPVTQPALLDALDRCVGRTAPS